MDRAQAHTLEAFMAALLVVSGVLFALGATAVTPLSASTSNQHIQNQQLAMANDLLATTAENGSLQTAILDWNTSEGGFASAGSNGYFSQAGPPNAFGAAINQTFVDQRIAVNVYVQYWDGTNNQQRPLVYMGAPSDNAVSASRTVVLYNDTRLTDAGGSVTVATAAADGDFYAPDLVPGNELFNVMEVRIVTWRM